MKLYTFYRIFQKCSGVTTDSRNCPKDSMFIALKGESFDGNAFAAQALENGCAYAVIDDAAYAKPGDKRFVIVPNGLTALQLLANYHRWTLRKRVIAITGTNGKTTTKELLAAILSQSFNVLCTEGNLNNHIGVPITLLRMRYDHDVAVIEMGANHPGEIQLLTDIVEPDYGLITNVGKAHLEGFGSFEGVMKTKGELYDRFHNTYGAPIFIHHDDPYLMEMNRARKLTPIYYGTDPSLYISGRVTGNSPYLTFEWKTKDDSEYREVQTQLIGEYNFANALAAITIGYFFRVSPEKIDAALTAYAPQNSRSQLKKTANNTLIIDAYNANPTSMMAALENFRNMTAAHKIVILGDMRELGAESAAEHQKIVDFIKECSFEQVLLVGEQFAAAEHPFPTYAHAPELIEELQAHQPQGAMILIKGSNGVKLSTVVDYL